MVCMVINAGWSKEAKARRWRLQPDEKLTHNRSQNPGEWRRGSGGFDRSEGKKRGEANENEILATACDVNWVKRPWEGIRRWPTHVGSSASFFSLFTTSSSVHSFVVIIIPFLTTILCLHTHTHTYKTGMQKKHGTVAKGKKEAGITKPSSASLLRVTMVQT